MFAPIHLAEKLPQWEQAPAAWTFLFSAAVGMEHLFMEDQKDHLSYVALDDAANKRRELTPSEWRHLRQCFECTLRLASVLAIEVDYEELRKKFPAA